MSTSEWLEALAEPAIIALAYIAILVAMIPTEEDDNGPPDDATPA